MAVFVFADNVSTTLAAAITTTSQTTVTLSSATNLPTIPSGQVWALTLNDAATQAVYEIVYVTARTGATLTVVRGQENTTALTWLVNDFAYGAITAGGLSNFAQSATAGAIAIDTSATNQTKAGGLTAGSLTSSGGASVAGQISTATLVASSNITGAGAIISGAISTSTLAASSNISGAGLTISGLTSTATLIASGNIAVSGQTSTSTLVASSNISGAGLSVSGAIGTSTLVASSNISGVGGIFSGAVSGTSFTASGNVNAVAFATNGGNGMFGGISSNPYIFVGSGGISAYVVNSANSGYLPIGASAFNVTSDRRAKEEIEPLALDALDAVSNLRPVQYKLKSNGEYHIGFIAQDVELVIPTAVTHDNDGHLFLNYSEMVPVLVAAMQSQQTHIASLEKRLSEAGL